MDFEQMREVFLADLSTRRQMVLATAAEGRVTARMMSVVVLGGRVWFQTDRRMEKAVQMAANPRVALTVDGYQMEGVVREAGRWADAAAVAEAYERLHRGSYQAYGALEDERAYEVTLTRIKKWEYAEGRPLVKDLDLERGTAAVLSPATA